VLKRTIREFRDDQLTDRAAALTYYGILSIFPALLALVSVLGLLGQGSIQPLIDNLREFAPGPARDLLTTVLKNLQNSQRTAGFFAIVGIAVALWSASGYVAAFMRASNHVYEMPEGRPIWIKLPVRVAVTAVLLVLLATGPGAFAPAATPPAHPPGRAGAHATARTGQRPATAARHAAHGCPPVRQVLAWVGCLWRQAQQAHQPKPGPARALTPTPPARRSP